MSFSDRPGSCDRRGWRVRPESWAWPWALFVLVMLLAARLGGLGGPNPAAAGEGRPILSASPAPGDICAMADYLPVHSLGEAGVDSIGREFSEYNLGVFKRTEDLYHAGAFGSVGSGQAKEAARRQFILHSWNGFDYIVRAASQGRIYSADEAAMREPFGVRYANTTVYPLRFLVRALIGPGGFCVEYSPPKTFDELSMLGGVPIRVHTDKVDEGNGPPAAALNVEFESVIHKTVELIYEHRFCGQVSDDVVVDRGDTLDLIAIHDLQGLYVRKFGLHRMGAMIYWRNHLTPGREPVHPRYGACAYFPHIQIKLPIFLPNIGLDDLREFDLPQAVMPMQWFNQLLVHQPDWIAGDNEGMLSPWNSCGPRPEIVEQRFPDL